MNTISRRIFLKNTACVTAGFFGLREFTLSTLSVQQYANQADIYGPLIPDPKQILDLPRGFSYTVLSRTGDFMSDGLRTPGRPDGMAAFPLTRRKTILIRNHENSPGQTFEGPFGLENELLPTINRKSLYDPGRGIQPHLGGTTTLVYDSKSRRLTKQFLSLAGTVRNCAGGPTPWNSWISCEESVERAGEHSEKDHGYNFEVPATTAMRLADPEPLMAMGRFNHEAVAVNPKTGVVYQTEDREDGLIFRLLPREYGNLKAGGVLQALAVKDQKSHDTRNWPEIEGSHFPINQPLDVEWLDMTDTDSPDDDLRYRGFEAGAARFARGEGMWFGNNEVFFACTNGGANKSGQIFRYIPSQHEGTDREPDHPGKLELYIEPNDTSLLEYCDNLTVAPWGDLIICEDGRDDQYVRGYTPEGGLYTLAHNSHSNSEFCGACFAPDHPTLFLNIQFPGITLAIDGPWQQSAEVV